MSRGLGKIERDVVALLGENDYLSALQIAGLIFVAPVADNNEIDLSLVTPVHLAAVRRALSSLRRKDLVWYLGRMYLHGYENHAVAAYAGREAALKEARKMRDARSTLSAEMRKLLMDSAVTTPR
jgi:hypothetical protein